MRQDELKKTAGTSGLLKIHPQNPHYFAVNGSPIILISSSDIYYDIFSPNYDFRKYLDSLAASEMNITRIYPAGCTAHIRKRLPSGIYLPEHIKQNGCLRKQAKQFVHTTLFIKAALWI